MTISWTNISEFKYRRYLAKVKKKEGVDYICETTVLKILKVG